MCSWFPETLRPLIHQVGLLDSWGPTCITELLKFWGIFIPEFKESCIFYFLFSWIPNFPLFCFSWSLNFLVPGLLYWERLASYISEFLLMIFLMCWTRDFLSSWIISSRDPGFISSRSSEIHNWRNLELQKFKRIALRKQGGQGFKSSPGCAQCLSPEFQGPKSPLYIVVQIHEFLAIGNLKSRYPGFLEYRTLKL